MIKVGIDITSLIYDRGVSRYTSNLVESLLTQPDITLYLYGSSLRQNKILKSHAKQLSNDHKNCKVRIQKFPPSMLTWLWKFRINSIKKQLPQIDLFHSWDWLQPPDKDLPLVSTVHDLAMLKYSKTAHPKVLKMHQESWKILKQRKAHLIAVSRSTKNDLVELLDFDPSLIHVIYEALPSQTQDASEQMSDQKYQQIKKQLKLDKPYLFFIGTREPRKNLKRLINAWKPLAKDCQLIIAGEKGWDKTSKKAQQAPEGLRFLGKVGNPELSVLYGEAKMLVYPSLYEGFGLPILESFYHGTPVVTSNVSSMPEVAGNAAELIDPNSVEDIRKGIEKILNENKEAQQKRLKQMIIRLQLFNWDKVAKQTIKVYQKAFQS